MSETTTRVKWSDVARAARETSEALAGEGWVVATIRARVLLADLADEVDRLAGERDALLEACRALLYLPSISANGADIDACRVEAERLAKAAIAGATGDGSPPRDAGPPAPPADAEIDARIGRRLATLREDIGRMREARERDPSARPTPPF